MLEAICSKKGIQFDVETSMFFIFVQLTACIIYFQIIISILQFYKILVTLLPCFLHRVVHGKIKEKTKKVNVNRKLKTVQEKIVTETVIVTVTKTEIEIVNEIEIVTEIVIVIGTEGEIEIVIEIVIVTGGVTETETTKTGTGIETEIVVVTETGIAGRILSEMIKISPDGPAAGELRVL